MTILGTRPEMIRLSLIIRRLDQLADQHVLVHTGQNYDWSLRDLFFQEMKIRTPDYRIHLPSDAFGKQVGSMFAQLDDILRQVAPDRVLVLGDTNSALAAVMAARMGIPTYHMEAGNRCFDTRVPEEVNRKIIDSIATFNLPYTQTSRENLLREGLPPHRIWMSGNPIFEVLQHFANQIESSDALGRLQLESQQYILVTAHRAENVDDPVRLKNIFKALQQISEWSHLPIVCSVHPRTRNRLQQFNLGVLDDRIKLCRPFGFFDFVKLQKNALCVVTDSGTVQEESCIYRVPAVTIRQSTERPETILCGSNTLSGLDPESIVACVKLAIQRDRTWKTPEGYDHPDVATKVTSFVLGGLYYV